MTFFANISVALALGGILSSDKVLETVDQIYNSLRQRDGIELTRDVLKTASKHVFSSVTGCKFSCNGDRVVPKKGFIPMPNGCGAYGFNLFVEHLYDLKQCCNIHDTCYSACGNTKSMCDSSFASCLASFCKPLSNRE